MSKICHHLQNLGPSDAYLYSSSCLHSASLLFFLTILFICYHVYFIYTYCRLLAQTFWSQIECKDDQRLCFTHRVGALESEIFSGLWVTCINLLCSNQIYLPNPQSSKTPFPSFFPFSLNVFLCFSLLSLSLLLPASVSHCVSVSLHLCLGGPP